MIFFTIVGVIACLAIGALIATVLFQIVGNVYGGIKGAYRLRAIRHRDGVPLYRHLPTIRLGLRAWTGKRYRDGVGHYWQIGGLEVPVDGRDPITREYYPG